MSDKSSSNFALLLLTIVSVVAIVSVAYVVFRQDAKFTTKVENNPEDQAKFGVWPPINNIESEKDEVVLKENLEQLKKIKPVEDEDKNTDPTKPAKIIKGIKERPSAVLEKDEYYLTEYTNTKSQRIPPEKEKPIADFIRWQYRFAGSVSGVVLPENGSIYFGTYDQQAFALDIKTGKIKHKQKTFSQAIGSTKSYNGNYIVPQRNGYVQCYEMETGKNIWNHRSAVHTKQGEIDISISGIRVHDKDIWISKHWGNLYIIDANTGVMKNDPGVHYESRINCLAVPLGNQVVYPNVAGELICYPQAGGTKPVFNHTIKSGYSLSRHSDGQYLYYNTTQKEFICLSPKTFTESWVIPLDGYGYQSILEDDDILYLAAKDIYAVNKKGEILWKHFSTTQNGFNRPMDCDFDHLYAASEEGQVVMLNKKTGEVKKTFELGGTIKNGVRYADGVIFVSNIDKRLFAIDQLH